MTSIGKEKKAVNAYLIKNSKGEGVGGMVGGGGGVGRHSEGLGRVVGLKCSVVVGLK